MEQKNEVALREDHHRKIDALEDAIFSSDSPILDFPLLHRFTAGMYIREIFMPAGSLLTTRIHKTQHPYILLTGKVSVFIPGGGAAHLTAPHVGVTEPGTRRVLYIHEDARWITFHVNADNETDPEAIVERVTDHSELPPGIESREQYLEEIHKLRLVDRDTEPQLDYGGAP